VAPAATTKLPSALSDTGTSAPAAASTPDATPPAADDDDNGDAANFTFAADQARLPAPPSTGQLSAAVSAASDRLAARLAQLSAAMSPGWPAESAALGAVSRLPVEVAGGEDPVVSAALARQLVRGGYALAGLVVAVVAWQLAASLPGEHGEGGGCDAWWWWLAQHRGCVALYGSAALCQPSSEPASSSPYHPAPHQCRRGQAAYRR